MTGLLPTITELERKLKIEFFDYQLYVFRETIEMDRKRVPYPRICLYHRTGAGKSVTALATLALWGYQEAVVIAPPSTHMAWQETAIKLGMVITTMSHALFRSKRTKLQKDVPIIADEIHMFGGQGKQGWSKLDRYGQHLKAPIILASATPNYNDAERVYCIGHILHPDKYSGGYIAFLYRECETEENPFSRTPNVSGFINYQDASEYLSAMENVFYLPDELVYTIDETYIAEYVPPQTSAYGYNPWKHRMIASQIEDKHTRIYQSFVTEDGWLTATTATKLRRLIRDTSGPVLIFVNHSTIAEAVLKTLNEEVGHHGVRLVTGKSSFAEKNSAVEAFNSGRLKVLIGTSTLATGTDGMDKVCDHLIILDDTEDDAQRRQLIGRIMPRGASSDTSAKRVTRFNLTSF